MTEISVIIPTYRPESYFRECLDSLWKQTLGHSCFEVIIVLNGCDEPYRSNITTWLKEAPSDIDVCLLQTDKGGVSNARNMGIKEAHGNYIAFIDDDDWLSDNYLENLLRLSDDGTIVVANVKNFDENNSKYIDDYIARAYKKNACRKKITLMSGRSFFSSCACKIIPKRVIGSHRFNTRFSQSEDALFMATLSKNVRAISLAPSDTIYYRRTRSGSVRHRRSKLQATADVLRTSVAFAGIYLSDMRHYHLPFFLTRILGLVKNMFRK